MNSHDTRQRLWRLGSIVVFCGLPLLLCGMIVLRIFAAWDAKDETGRQQAVLSQIVGQLARHRPRALSAADTTSLYLAGASASLARAELQDRMSKMVGQAGGRVTEIQAVGTPDSESDGLVASHVALSIDNSGLRDLLYAIETGLPLLDVADIDINRDTSRVGDPSDPLASDNRLLDVEMTVKGHWRKTTG